MCDQMLIWFLMRNCVWLVGVDFLTVTSPSRRGEKQRRERKEEKEKKKE